MVASLNQFLVVLLVLLQAASPLVHAHVGKFAGHSGLHLHEFEKLQPLIDNAIQVSSDQQISAPAAIVGLGSAIELTLADDDFSSVFYLYSNIRSFFPHPEIAVVNFSPPETSFVPEPSLNHNPTRAPPL